MKGYPGETTLIVTLSRGDDIGDVRVQRYSDKLFRVATFLPGFVVWFPGDTPKVEPEQSEWKPSLSDCSEPFSLFLEQAVANGWKLRA